MGGEVEHCRGGGVETKPSKTWRCTNEVQAGQFGALVERIGFDAGNAGGKREAGETGTILERAGADGGDAVGDLDVREAGAPRA